jgi:hypothetical protein
LYSFHISCNRSPKAQYGPGGGIEVVDAVLTSSIHVVPSEFSQLMAVSVILTLDGPVNIMPLRNSLRKTSSTLSKVAIVSFSQASSTDAQLSLREMTVTKRGGAGWWVKNFYRIY